ncbi:quinone oxidoreductase family protein [Nocardioides acrostichi]|uniref:Zinc-binding alcohol dehydrogenase family protein n=1 Tax=Nocardioides acrostichi TaxID=2784339 RepID=A0A930UXL3_9ACTN|nr:zinc-binding alcohol dehydrogenase family protein [Nocardioides acrostichi]MBF4162738.1 zinc-binding alcohol dehydrogenase family protein [Nocardioides acrostichi]
MRAALIRDLGSAPVVADIPRPEAGDGVLVDITTAALNPADLVYASGVRLRPSTPFVPGIEGVGTTAEGTRVYFHPAVHPDGSLAEYAVARAGRLHELPDDISDEQALCLGVAGTTAWLALTYKGRIRAGESVLVLGATGSVGQIAVQAARALGAGRVVAAGRDLTMLETLRGRGADSTVVLDDGYAERLVEESRGGFDLVVDSLYAEPMVAGLAALRPGGRLVNLGMRAGRSAEVPGIPLKGRDLLSLWVDIVPAQAQAEAFHGLCTLAREGGIEAAYELTELDDIAATWQRQAASPHRKLLVGF